MKNSKLAPELFTCPHCRCGNFTPAGLQQHNCERRQREHPFAVPAHPSMNFKSWCYVIGADDRIALIKKSGDRRWLEKVRDHFDSQRTVQAAALRRLKRISRKGSR